MAARERRTQVIALVALVLYVGVTHATMGLRLEHGVLASLTLACIVHGGKGLDFLSLFWPVMLTGITYDYFRLMVPLRGAIHVDDLYQAEMALFGIDGTIPALWLENHTHWLADLVAGLAYILYLYVPMVSSIVFFWIDKERQLAVGMAFLCTNLLGMAVYLAYPAAPPWYVADYGLGPADLSAVPNAAGAVRFDHLLGIDYFTEFYKRSANVFGAMPSLHTAYPASTALALIPKGRKWWVPAAVFSVIVGISAVYLQHHYILDVLAGAACALLGFAISRPIVTALRERTPALVRVQQAHA